jgi:hypothetical protein
MKIKYDKITKNKNFYYEAISGNYKATIYSNGSIRIEDLHFKKQVEFRHYTNINSSKKYFKNFINKIS